MGTLIARLIGSILGWGALMSGRFVIKVYLEDMIRPKWDIGRQIMKIGLPSALQGLSRNISRFMLFAILLPVTNKGLLEPSCNAFSGARQEQPDSKITSLGILNLNGFIKSMLFFDNIIV